MARSPKKKKPMQPEHCPFHGREDTCVATARLLVHAGLLDPAPHAPAARRATAGVPPIPPRPVTLAMIAEHVNAWGRVVIDPTLPHADVTALRNGLCSTPSKPCGKPPARPPRGSGSAGCPARAA